METATDIDVATNDLGPLAWVLDELRKSLDSASAALRRFVRDTGLARGSDMASVDGGHLRIARQQLHQAVGALEMVGLGAPAHMLRCMEAAVQRFIDKPELCDEAASSKVERAGFALTEYLEGVLLGKAASSVALFPQYREVQEVAGADRVHPADLWSLEWRWNEPDTPQAEESRVYDPAVRSRMDQSVLKVMKSGDPEAAREMVRLSLSLAATQAARQPRIFWKICAAYFEAIGLGLLPLDIYVKRAGSRVLLQYATLAKGEQGVSDRLAQDLVFFCAQVAPPAADQAPSLAAVRHAWGLGRFAAVDYNTAQFGRFDPVLLAQARKRIAAAKETWSNLSGGDVGKLKGLAEQFHLVTDSLTKLYPPSAPLAGALSNVIDTVVRSGRAPAAELAMEIATAVLYLEAAFEDLDPADTDLAARIVRLAERLDTANQGGQTEALEPWMEELYRRVSDRQTMGSVVSELRGTLAELEKVLDQFFRSPQDKTPLRDAPGHLSQMRGVLSVLGLDQAAQAVVRMRDSVEEIIVTEIDEQRARSAGTFDKLGNNLGALGFLIDMLNYQPSLAKKLFVYDDASGELRPLMGRTSQPVPQADSPAPEDGTLVAAPALQGAPASLEPLSFDLGDGPSAPVLQTAAAGGEPAQAVDAFEISFEAQPPAQAPATASAVPAPSVPAPTAPPAVEDDVEEDDLRDIFLEEAREVVQNGLAALAALAASPGDVAELTTLRRAFHTLKGSSRMVGLSEFGDAAWSLEQVLNTWLADQKPASDDLRALSVAAMQGFGRWVEDIASRSDAAWKSAMFSGPADALRTEHRLLPLLLPDEASVAPLAVVESAPAQVLVAELPDFDFDLDASPQQPSPSVESAELPPEPVEIEGIDFGSLAAVTGAFDEKEVPPDTAPAEASASPGLEISFSDAEGEIDLSVFELRPAAPAVDLSGISSITRPEPEMELDLEPETTDADADAAPEAIDEQTKVIGSLRIGIPLYNVYLNEADEWSRRLATEVTEWSLEMNLPVADSTVGLAHALAGSSATVGFNALSNIARALESALAQTQSLAYGTDAHGRAFTDAAEEIRRLLHQFAAGFLKDPDGRVIEALHALRELDIPQRADVEDSRFNVTEAQTGEAATQPEEVSLQILDIAAELQPPADPPIAAPQPTFVAVTPEPSKPQPVPQARQAQDFGDDQDDIDLVDALDPDLFPVFEEEAAELMPQLGGALRQWSARPDNRSARDEVLRALHTLKGSARLAGALRLGELSHRMESQIEQIATDTPDATEFEALLLRFDGMQANFDTLRITGGASALPADPDATASGPIGALPAATTDVSGVSQPEPALQRRVPLAQPATTHLAPQRAAASQAVRVRSQLLDRLVNQAGEVMITRSRLEAELRQLRGSLADLTGNLDRLRSQLRDIELQAESQMQSRLAQAKDSAAGFDPLEFDRFTRVQELTRMMAESVNDVATVQRNLQRTVEATEDDLIAQARQTRELQRDLLRTRMVEFEGISERLYRVIRLASKEAGKQVKLDIIGGTIEMDRGVLDRMTPAFEHLLRNCVAHGIEDSTTRLAAGKDASGTIVIDLQHEGNDVSVEFRDDGAGLNLPRIREKAMQQGLVPAGQEISDQEAAQLIFMPGFSTATQVTELSGRGIGMDVVRAEVNALGGRIETNTVAGQGTRFKLVLPLTTAVTQVVMIRCGSLSVGVPAHMVEIVRRAPLLEVQGAYESGVFSFGGEELPFFWSGALLQYSPRTREPQTKTLPVVVFRSAAQRIAVHVDEVLGNQEVVVKNLGPQLARLPGLAGMTVLASGAVVLIYNPVALTSVYGEQARQLSVAAEAADQAGSPAQPAPVVQAAAQIPLVLVVDDSITVRRVTQRLLQREGYRVALAADGLQALEKLAEERPAVVLSDIEMPRMDGFDLARNIRGDESLKSLPIVMITSRIAEKHREHARELGVDHYLGKPYSEEELLSLVKHYSGTAVSA